jgi:hypothetical protein
MLKHYALSARLGIMLKLEAALHRAWAAVFNALPAADEAAYESLHQYADQRANSLYDRLHAAQGKDEAGAEWTLRHQLAELELWRQRRMRALRPVKPSTLHITVDLESDAGSAAFMDIANHLENVAKNSVPFDPEAFPSLLHEVKTGFDARNYLVAYEDFADTVAADYAGPTTNQLTEAEQAKVQRTATWGKLIAPAPATRPRGQRRSGRSLT